MNTPLFVNAFTAFNELADHFTPEQKLEYQFYSLLCDISVKIVNYRAQHALTQKQLAEKLGVAQSMVAKYESGTYNFSIRTLSELCAKLGFTLDINLGPQNDPIQQPIAPIVKRG